MRIVASILDKFTEQSLSKLGFVNLLRSNILEFLNSQKADLFFFESVWNGADNSWCRFVSHIDEFFVRVILACKNNNLPIIFWGKEDPVHFHRFLMSSSLADYVFTSDISSLILYKRLLGHGRVYLLPFASSMYDPIVSLIRSGNCSFAGTYYVRYPERLMDMRNIFDGVLSVCGLDIYDRYKDSSDVNYQFPENYQPFIKGSLPPDQIEIAYKGYTYGINLNTVKNSESMFARRVFELLGSGTVTISNESPGIRFLFGDLVITSDNAEEIRQRLQEMVDNPVLRSKVALAGVRKVLLEHTYAHRLERVYSIVFSTPEKKQTLPSVCVVASVGNLAQLQNLQQMLLAQEDGLDWHAVLVVADGADMAVMQQALTDERISCVPQTEVSHHDVGDLLGDAQWVAGWHADDYYGPNFLLDLLLGTRYCNAPVLGKAAMFIAADSGPTWINQEAVYRPMAHVQARCSVLKSERISAVSVCEWLALVASGQPLPEVMAEGAMALDAFSYCRDVWSQGLPQAEVSAVVDDLELNKGHSIDELYAKAEAMPVHMPAWVGKPAWRLQKLADAFGAAGVGEALHGSLDKFGWHLVSEIHDGDYASIWAENTVPVDELGGSAGLKFHVVEGPGLPVELLVRFETEGGRVLSELMFETNSNQQWLVPNGASHVRLGFRVFSSGTTRIMRFALTWL